MTTDREQAGLLGLVHTVERKTVPPVKRDGLLVEEVQSSSVTRFDPAGHKIEEIHYQEDGSLQIRFTASYDEAGRLRERIDYHSDGSVWRTLHTYTESGRPLGLKRYVADGSLVHEETYTFDDRGHRVEETFWGDNIFDNDAMISLGAKGTDYSFSVRSGDVERIQSTYDSQERPLEVAAYNDRGKQTGLVRFTRNEQGQLIKIVYYGGGDIACEGGSGEIKQSGLLQRAAPYLFKGYVFLNSAYHQIRQREWRKLMLTLTQGAPTTEINFVYDPAGRLAEERANLAGFGLTKKIYQYDLRGNKVEESMYLGETLTLQQRHSYEFDAVGNWIKEEMTYADLTSNHAQLRNVKVTTTRTITYY